MANTAANNAAELAVATGWAYLQTWSTVWGPNFAGQASSLDAYVLGLYS